MLLREVLGSFGRKGGWDTRDSSEEKLVNPRLVQNKEDKKS